MLELLEQDYRVVNIDESWINELDFQRRKWHDRTESNSLPKKAVFPRLSLLAAIETTGRVFMAVTTINTTSEVVCLFVRKLVDALALEDPDFREKLCSSLTELHITAVKKSGTSSETWVSKP